LNDSDKRVAVVGATGVVGGQLIALIGERNFPHKDLKLFASDTGHSVEMSEKQLPVDGLSDPSELADFDIAFLAVPQSCASEICRANPGPLLIDLSAATRGPSNLPMVAPGLTSREQVVSLKEKIVEVPHPCAQAIAIILDALRPQPGFAAALLQLSASSLGKSQVDALFKQSADLLSAKFSSEEDEPQIAFNLFSDEWSKNLAAVLPLQIQKLGMKLPALAISAMHAPVFHGTILSVLLQGALEESRDQLRKAPGVLLVEDEESPGIIDAVGQEALMITIDRAEAGLAVSCAFDNARRAALSALWIAECLAPQGKQAMN
jgi:aspartate-semialdehyde dehydrogenase